MNFNDFIEPFSKDNIEILRRHGGSLEKNLNNEHCCCLNPVYIPCEACCVRCPYCEIKELLLDVFNKCCKCKNDNESPNKSHINERKDNVKRKYKSTEDLKHYSSSRENKLRREEEKQTVEENDLKSRKHQNNRNLNEDKTRTKCSKHLHEDHNFADKYREFKSSNYFPQTKTVSYKNLKKSDEVYDDDDDDNNNDDVRRDRHCQKHSLQKLYQKRAENSSDEDEFNQEFYHIQKIKSFPSKKSNKRIQFESRKVVHTSASEDECDTGENWHKEETSYRPKVKYTLKKNYSHKKFKDDDKFRTWKERLDRNSNCRAPRQRDIQSYSSGLKEEKNLYERKALDRSNSPQRYATLNYLQDYKKPTKHRSRHQNDKKKQPFLSTIPHQRFHSAIPSNSDNTKDKNSKRISRITSSPSQNRYNVDRSNSIETEKIRSIRSISNHRGSEKQKSKLQTRLDQMKISDWLRIQMEIKDRFRWKDKPESNKRSIASAPIKFSCNCDPPPALQVHHPTICVPNCICRACDCDDLYFYPCHDLPK